MARSAKSKAEEKFAQLQKQQRRALKEREKVQQERTEKVARLRALRLAKEADDKAAAKAETRTGKRARASKKPPCSRSSTTRPASGKKIT